MTYIVFSLSTQILCNACNVQSKNVGCKNCRLFMSRGRWLPSLSIQLFCLNTEYDFCHITHWRPKIAYPCHACPVPSLKEIREHCRSWGSVWSIVYLLKWFYSNNHYWEKVDLWKSESLVMFINSFQPMFWSTALTCVMCASVHTTETKLYPR